ncbi:hypothetical protein THIOM_003373 [Candidatus Thiomargarita nelsonii]|uniref:Uncharacterized protein n=1 Tax=Candidatus Thiomargarita nelsonii TaxID=1003181 RepID=A0A176RYM5_9GAMM|nr:hypothetical protein THIOM_003373 [Candidatus Thiomargarita nelsonii]
MNIAFASLAPSPVDHVQFVYEYFRLSQKQIGQKQLIHGIALSLNAHHRRAF